MQILNIDSIKIVQILASLFFSIVFFQSGIDKIIDRKGIINVGGPTKTVYNFAKKYNPKVKKIFIKKNSLYNYPLNPFMNLSKLKKIIK